MGSCRAATQLLCAEEDQEQSKPEQDATAAFEAGSESDYDDVDFGKTGKHAIVPDPGVLIDWDQLLTAQPAAADNGSIDPLEQKPTSAPAVLPHAGESWVLDEATALVDAALTAGDKGTSSASKCVTGSWSEQSLLSPVRSSLQAHEGC